MHICRASLSYNICDIVTLHNQIGMCQRSVSEEVEHPCRYRETLFENIIHDFKKCLKQLHQTLPNLLCIAGLALDFLNAIILIIIRGRHQSTFLEHPMQNDILSTLVVDS